MNAVTWRARPNGTVRAAIGIVVWLGANGAAAWAAFSYAIDGASQLCWVLLAFLGLCVLSVGIFRGSKEQEANWIMKACVEAMRWQLLVASVIGAIGLTVIIERHGGPVREVLGNNFGNAWMLLVFAASGAGVGTVLTRSYAVAIEAREERESREEMVRAIVLAVRESDDERFDAMASAIGREVAEAVRLRQPKKASLWRRIFGR